MQHPKVTIFLPLLGVGVALGLSVMHPILGWVVFPALYACFYFLQKFRLQLWRQILFLYGVWVVKTLVVLSFLWSTFPMIRYETVASWQQIALILFSIVIATLAISVGSIVVSLFLYGWWRWGMGNKYVSIFLISVVWVLGEIVGSGMYSLATLGSGSTVQTYFSFGYVGYALANIPGLIYYATFGGVYLLSFLTVLVTVSTLLLNHKKVVITVFLAMLFFGLLALRHTTIPPIGRIALVHTDLRLTESTEEFYKNKTDVLSVAVEQAHTYYPKYIILPEDSRYLDLVFGAPSPQQSYGVYQFTETSEVIVVDSSRAQLGETDRVVVEARTFSAKIPPVRTYKQYLTPQGEYVPLLTRTLFTMTGNREALSHPRIGNYSIGPLVSINKKDIPAVLFCFEAVRPTAVRALLSQYEDKPPFVAHPVSHAWFHQSYLFSHQLDAMLRVQAVWNRIPIVSAGNISKGKVYLPNGSYHTPLEVVVGKHWSVQLVDL